MGQPVIDCQIGGNQYITTYDVDVAINQPPNAIDLRPRHLPTYGCRLRFAMNISAVEYPEVFAAFTLASVTPHDRSQLRAKHPGLSLAIAFFAIRAPLTSAHCSFSDRDWSAVRSMNGQHNPSQKGERTMATQKPQAKFKMGRIQAAVWKNDTEKGSYFTVTINRRYRTGDGWKSSTAFSRNDLPLVAKVADLAHTWIYDNGNGESESEAEVPTEGDDGGAVNKRTSTADNDEWMRLAYA